MTKRTAPKGQKAGVRTESGESMSAFEEKVVRMRQGYALPDGEKLGRVGQDRPDIAKQLLEMEQRAFEKSGRLAKLRQEAAGETGEGAVAKAKIIAGLKEKSTSARKR
jgi:hypothetical protein